MTGDGAASPQAREDTTFGLWIFIASEAMFFGALFLAYAWGRVRHPAGFAAASRATDVVLGSVNTALLLTSSAVVALAVACAGEQRRTRAVAPLLALAALLGTAFLAIKGVEWRREWTEGLFPGPAFRLPGTAGAAPAGSALFFALYFVATGVHALHLLAGVALLLVVAAGSRRAPAVWCAGGRLDAAGLYWHFVDVVWIVLWPLLYLVARQR